MNGQPFAVRWTYRGQGVTMTTRWHAARSPFRTACGWKIPERAEGREDRNRVDCVDCIWVLLGLWLRRRHS